MFRTKHVMSHSLPTNFFESDMPNGIDYDLLLIPQSPIYVRVDSEINEYPPFTAFYFPKNTPYYYAPAIKDGEVYEDCFIQFISDDNFMQNRLIPIGQPIYLQDAANIITLTELLAFENFFRNENSDLIIDFLMKTIILKIHDSVPKTDIIPYRNELYELRQAIAQSPEKQWNLSEMAESLHISPGYLHLLYKKLFFTTCKQDVIAGRIEKAKHLLAQSSQDIKNISYACGYNNTEHFCRQFYKCTGSTPSEYRKRHLN